VNNIDDYLSKKENEKLEFKESFSGNVKEKIFKTICAFANDYSNNDWKVSPKPKISIDLLTKNTNNILVIEITPSPFPTYYDKNMYIRIGSTTRVANAMDIQKVLEQFKNTSFESSDCLSASIDDIDEELFILYQREFIDESIINKNQRSLLQKLSAPSFANIISKYPTYAGLIVCGKNIDRHLPMAKFFF